MKKKTNIVRIQSCLKSGKLQWRQHALERMMERGVAREEVYSTIQNGEILEIYSEDKPFPSYLVHGGHVNPLHVVLAVDPDSGVCHIITVYRPDSIHFEDDFRTRRKE